MNLAFSVIAMEWFDKISEFMEGLPEWLQAHPRYVENIKSLDPLL